MKDINIETEIRTSLFIKNEGLKTIVQAYLEENGYEVDGEVVFDVRRRCTGYGEMEREELYLDGVRVDVKKKQ